MKYPLLLALVASLGFVSLTGCGGTYYRLDGKTADEWAEGLENEDWKVRMDAVTKLGIMAEEEPRAVEHLADALDDPVADVRMSAIRVLSGIGEHASLAAQDLARVSENDPEQYIRNEAKNALAQLRQN